VLAFDRGGAVTVVTRLPDALAERGGWGDTTIRLPAGTWSNVLDGGLETFQDEVVRLDDLMAELPVALLVKES